MFFCLASFLLWCFYPFVLLFFILSVTYVIVDPLASWNIYLHFSCISSAWRTLVFVCSLNDELVSTYCSTNPVNLTMREWGAEIGIEIEKKILTAEETTRTEAVGIAEEGAGMKIVGVLGTMNTAGCDGKTLMVVVFPFLPILVLKQWIL